MDETRLHRRVAGWHDIRLDGLWDLILRAHGSSVIDVGCNRALVADEFFRNGARLVHGCDNYEEGIQFARQLFIDRRNCQSQFEVVDLTQGPVALAPFGDGCYDIVLFLGTYHKIERIMDPELLTSLVRYLGSRTTRYFAFRSTSLDHFGRLDSELGACGLKRIHTSEISDLGPTGIWRRD